MTGQRPAFIAYSVKSPGKGGKDFFIRIGAAWPFEPGKTGFTVQLDTLPLDGRIVLCEPRDDKPEAEAEDGGAQLAPFSPANSSRSCLRTAPRPLEIPGPYGDMFRVPSRVPAHPATSRSRELSRG